MKKPTRASAPRRLRLLGSDLDDKVTDLCADIEDIMFGMAESDGRFVDRPEHHGTNDALMRAVDQWEDQNGFKRHRM